MAMHNLIEYLNNCSKTSGRLLQYYGDKTFLDANVDIASFPSENNNSGSFKFKTKMVVEQEIKAKKILKSQYY